MTKINKQNTKFSNTVRAQIYLRASLISEDDHIIVTCKATHDWITLKLLLDSKNC